MKILFYSTKTFEQPYLQQANDYDFDIHFSTLPLSADTVSLAEGFDAISIFTADDASASVVEKLAKAGVNFIAIRAAGYDNVDIDAVNNAGIVVANVPEYSPYAIAEHAVALMLALNRKIIIATEQVKRQYFLLDNLVGFDLHGKTIGIIGTGKIGTVLAKIMHGFGCSILAYDLIKNEELTQQHHVRYVDLAELCSSSNIISIHTPLNQQTKHLISEPFIKIMKKGVMLINTARGGVVKTEDIIAYLENGRIGCYGADVYEKEKGVFFFDRRNDSLNDPQLKKLLSMPNVLITPHQAFATKEALTNIATTTISNINSWKNGLRSGNELTH
jgi:D-lactate dehydrogenase